MDPQRTPDCNHTLGCSPESGVSGLPVRMLVTPESEPVLGRTGLYGFASYWKPDDMERQILAAGGFVVLNVYGNHPPVELKATPDFKRNPDIAPELERLMKVARLESSEVGIEDLQTVLAEFHLMKDKLDAIWKGGES